MNKKTIVTAIVVVLIIVLGLAFTVNPELDLKDRIISIVDMPKNIFEYIVKNDKNDKKEQEEEIVYNSPNETPIDFFVDEPDDVPPIKEETGEQDEKEKDESSSDINKLPIDILG